MAGENGVSVIPYSPAAARLLSGKYFGQASGRLKTNKRYGVRYSEAWAFDTAEKYIALYKAKACTRSARRSPGRVRTPRSPRPSSARATSTT
jgi:aryl-alcohol dehydrogenase-like predicted oxidoreductase